MWAFNDTHTDMGHVIRHVVEAVGCPVEADFSLPLCEWSAQSGESVVKWVHSPAPVPDPNELGSLLQVVTYGPDGEQVWHYRNPTRRNAAEIAMQIIDHLAGESYA